MIIDELISAIKRVKNPSVVGIDTAFNYLPEKMKANVKTNEEAANAILAFNKEIIDSVYDIIPAVKVQVAYYESYGVAGMNCFKETLAYAKSKGLITIADVKRNDIGATSKAYSNTFLGKNDLGLEAEYNCDFVTLNGYLGIDGIKPFNEDCSEFNKGSFILVRTSNPSSKELQNLKFENGNFLYEQMGDLVQSWGEDLIGEYGYSSVGAVVGATQKQEADVLRKRLKSVFFLVPGYGAQGGTSEDLEVCFDENGLGAIVNSSRGIICAYKKEENMLPGEAARKATIAMRDDIVGTLIAKGKTNWLD